MSDIKLKIDDESKEVKSASDIEKEVINNHREENGQDPIDSDPDTVKMVIPTDEVESQEEDNDEQQSAESNLEDNQGSVEEIESPSYNEDGDIVLNEEQVYKFLSAKIGREVESIEDLVEEKEVELDEDVAAYQKYKKETGRSISDYIELNKDYDSIDDSEVVKMYMKETLEGFDSDDIDWKFNSDYGYDEYEEESTIRGKKLELKQAAIEARKHFNQQKEQYKIPLESRTNFIPEEEREAYAKFKEQSAKMSEQAEIYRKKQEVFSEKSRNLFNEKFEGFEFKTGDQNYTYKPGDKESIMKSQMDVTNFLNKHLDDNGFLKDAAAYHKALSVAMNPDSFFEYAYELGKASAIEDSVKTSKNIDMEPRKASSVRTTSGLKVTDANANRNSGLRIRKRK